MHTKIINQKRGIKLQGVSKLFRSLTDLVEYFSSNNPDKPNLLSKPEVFSIFVVFSLQYCNFVLYSRI